MDSMKLSVPLRKMTALMASAESPALNYYSRILSAAPLIPLNAFRNSQRSGETLQAGAHPEGFKKG
ncbi:hypothetical protein T06_14944 [Trichinella sp. T6]|nr:hypothetical protein T06_14944 [Trichinella sp. T6]